MKRSKKLYGITAWTWSRISLQMTCWRVCRNRRTSSLIPCQTASSLISYCVCHTVNEVDICLGLAGLYLHYICTTTVCINLPSTESLGMFALLYILFATPKSFPTHFAIGFSGACWCRGVTPIGKHTVLTEKKESWHPRRCGQCISIRVCTGHTQMIYMVNKSTNPKSIPLISRCYKSSKPSEGNYYNQFTDNEPVSLLWCQSHL